MSKTYVYFAKAWRDQETAFNVDEAVSYVIADLLPVNANLEVQEDTLVSRRQFLQEYSAEDIIKTVLKQLLNKDSDAFMLYLPKNVVIMADLLNREFFIKLYVKYENSEIFKNFLKIFVGILIDNIEQKAKDKELYESENENPLYFQTMLENFSAFYFGFVVEMEYILHKMENRGKLEQCLISNDYSQIINMRMQQEKVLLLVRDMYCAIDGLAERYGCTLSNVCGDTDKEVSVFLLISYFNDIVNKQSLNKNDMSALFDEFLDTKNANNPFFYFDLIFKPKFPNL